MILTAALVNYAFMVHVIAVSDILNLLVAGYTIADIPQQYPGLTKKDCWAALEFASTLTEEPQSVPTRLLAQSVCP